MKVTEEELINMYKYFQYCCLPSIVMAKYAYCDYIDDIKQEKGFCKHKTKQVINKMGKYLEMLPNKLMDTSNQNVRYMNILGDNIEELLEDEAKEMYDSIYISFKNAKFQHLECLTALHYISTMLQLSSITFLQCCQDLEKMMHKNPIEIFHLYNLHEVTKTWYDICSEATVFFGYNKDDKKTPSVDLNNTRTVKAATALRDKLVDIKTLREAMRKSYPWSLNYKEGQSFEDSADYIISGGKNVQN